MSPKPSQKLPEPVHFIGIGGSGMSSLAMLGKASGESIRGSDQKDSEASSDLKRLGIEVYSGHSPAHLRDAKTVVYSSAVKDSNVELAEARRLGLRILHRSDYLAHLMENHQAITVAGTHGKTTTSALITHVLTALGCDPSAAIGGVVNSLGTSARHGNGSYFVAEADESDGTFLKYRPYVGVLTNVDLDHMDFFGSAENLESAFKTYLGNVHPEGTAVVGWDHERTRRISQNLPIQRLTYGTILGSEVRAFDYKTRDGGIDFTAIVEHDRIHSRINMPGIHNLQNALCALAVARALELDIQLAAEAVASFDGVARRLQLVYESSSTRIVDDYAHNPGKVSAVINAVRDAWPDKKLTVIFQPHRYSRLATLYDETLRSFSKANRVIVLPVYSAGEPAQPEFSPERLANDIAATCKVETFPKNSFTDTMEFLKSFDHSEQVFLTVGAGDVHKVATQLREYFRGQEEQAIPGRPEAAKKTLEKKNTP